MRGGLNADHHGGRRTTAAAWERSGPATHRELHVPVSLDTSIDGHPITIEPVPAHDFVQFAMEKGL